MSLLHRPAGSVRCGEEIYFFQSNKLPAAFEVIDSDLLAKCIGYRL